MAAKDSPPIPEYRAYFNPILRALEALGGSASIDELNARVAVDMKLSDEVLARAHDPDRPGRSEVGYRMAWARTYLKASGLITNSERGVWALTPEGTRAGHVDEKKLAKEVAKSFKPDPIRDRPEGADAEGNVTGEEEVAGSDWKSELLELLHQMPPDAFERLCQRLLRESGFVEVRVTGRTGDNGIDGIGLLRLQEVLSFHVIFQCKRVRDPVGASTIRDFRGAMVGRTDKGLVIATSYFTRDAVREATRDGAPAIDLIDGEDLVALLKKLKLGVQTELVERISVHREWFATL